LVVERVFGYCALVAIAGATRDLESLRRLVNLSSPVTMAREHTMPVLEQFAELFPEGGLRRGSTVGVDGPGATTLAVALGAQVSMAGSWVAAVGMPDLGLSTVTEVGAQLERWALIEDPGDHGSEVVSALVGAVDLVLLGPRVRMRIGHTRKLAARMRERGTTVVQVRPMANNSLSSDITLSIEASRWIGVEQGHGRLQARRVEISAQGRGSAARPRRSVLWLPGPDGRVATVERRLQTVARQVPRWERSAAEVVELTQRVS
jgi:cellobiose-specific phosphotransferase system component IIB